MSIFIPVCNIYWHIRRHKKFSHRAHENNIAVSSVSTLLGGLGPHELPFSRPSSGSISWQSSFVRLCANSDNFNVSWRHLTPFECSLVSSCNVRSGIHTARYHLCWLVEQTSTSLLTYKPQPSHRVSTCRTPTRWMIMPPQKMKFLFVIHKQQKGYWYVLSLDKISMTTRKWR